MSFSASINDQYIEREAITASRNFRNSATAPYPLELYAFEQAVQINDIFDTEHAACAAFTESSLGRRRASRRLSSTGSTIARSRTTSGDASRFVRRLI